MSFKSFVQALALAAVATFGATAAQAAGTQTAPRMILGAAALPPTPYIELCARQPLACGSDAAKVLAGAAQAEAERRALLGGPAAPAAPTAAYEAPEAAPELTPALWSALTEANARVNRAIRPVKDSAARDTWSLPLADGRRAGDCEDYALEKVRALVAAGVPRSALNLATAVTPWGENHAVLIVSAAAGDFVLDNLQAKVSRWDEVPYAWGKRQVGGRAFEWAMVRRGAAVAAGD
ncbi:transglutaminase-like cysteine peptidase [Phenylobacterium sp. J426]|uniref:transglutaminase-like cysteine peptidase n=1 Tax=Phenylobacterium sp. J426 TaxID=2898439 RepID=UPI00215182A4|nr:transglutaminase-like cysteine peptidase [Phenylobacterium sp. J426]MCR5873871.1 transglutaminase-like cysteine peptidase [Phenylobacterium sp. J426]